MIAMIFLFFIALSAINCEDASILSSRCLIQLEYVNQSQFRLLKCYQFSKQFWSSTNWGDCTYRCCSPVITYDQVRQSIDRCDSDRTSYYNRMAGIVVGSIFGGLAGIGLLVLIGVKIQEKCKEMPASQRRREIQSEMSNAHINLSYQWIKLPKRKVCYNCPVCLQPKPNVEFSLCRHLAHVECWKEWRKRRGNCVICREPLLAEMKIYCVQCYQAYYTCRAEDIKSIKDSKLACDDCN